MAMPLDQEMGRSFDLLDEEECLDLLHKGWLGRVVISLGAIPVVFPVNYCMEDGIIYFLTGIGTKLTAALRSTVVAFEVDEVDIRYHHGWSVLAVGTASMVEDEAVRKIVGNRIQPWAPGERNHLVRIQPELLTGRRISFE
jgi:nitroimidazol reductase NimA-like FMN-containing flavoprotein (pyridoxamine 5'-phosphate oxidase superfamily)